MGFDPFTIFTVVGAVVGGVQSVFQGMASAAGYENQARAAEANSRIAAMNAQIAESEGKLATANTAQDWYRKLGRQRAAMAQGGVLESATGELVRSGTEEMARQEEFAVQHQYDMKELGYNFESQDLLSQASVARSNAGQASLGGWLGGVGSLAGGLSSAYGYKQKYGVKPGG